MSKNYFWLSVPALIVFLFIHFQRESDNRKLQNEELRSSNELKKKFSDYEKRPRTVLDDYIDSAQCFFNTSNIKRIDGVSFNVCYPCSWRVNTDIHNDGIVQYIHEMKDNAVALTVGVALSNVALTKEYINKLMTKEAAEGRLTKDSKLITCKKIVVAKQPAFETETTQHTGVIYSHSIQKTIYYKNHIIWMNYSVYSESNRSISGLLLRYLDKFEEWSSKTELVDEKR